MLVLDAGDDLRGDASAASKVDYTVNGIVGTAPTPLANGQLADSEGSLYKSQRSAVAILAITLVNTDTSARTCNLYIKPSGGTSRRIIPKDTSLSAGYSLHTDGVKITILTTSGELVEASTPTAHKDSHDPEDGSDPLDTAAASEIAGVQAAGVGSSHSLARADHAHAINHGITDNHLVTVDGTPNDDEYARFTANGIEGRTEAEFKGDFNLEIGTDVLAEQTIGIADDNLVEMDDADAADDDYAKFTANGLEGRSYTEVKTDLSLNNVENTAHSTDAHTMTIDGRDVSVDGTKLDGIATGADVTGDNAPQAHATSHTDGTDDIQDAAADDSTKGIATFEADDFDSASGKIDLAVSVTKASTTDSGTATPTGHDLGIKGGEGIDTSGSGADVTISGEDASDSNKGIVELATAAETTTGTDTGRAVTPDGLAGSIFGEKIMYIKVIANDTALTTGNGQAHVTIPDALNGMNLVDADAAVYTASTSGTPTMAIYNATDSQDMLSTNITIDANEKTSYTAATQPVINTSYDDVATGDDIQVDVDVAGTGTKGLDVILTFQVP